MLLFFIVNRFRIPIFFDTIGTLTVAGFSGLFPGILTAVLTSILCAFFDENALYYMFINVVFAIFSVWYIRKYGFKKVRSAAVFALITGIVSGIAGALLQWLLFGGAQYTPVAELVTPLSEALNLPSGISFSLGNILVSLIDKVVTTAIAFIVFKLIPEKNIAEIYGSGWKQRPLTEEELRNLKGWGKDVRLSARSRMTLTLVSMSFVLIIIMGWIGITLYFDNEKNSRIDSLWNTVEFVSETLDVGKLDNYLQKGRDADGYSETEEMITKITNNAYGVRHLYVIKVGITGARYIFYINRTDDGLSYEPGDKMEFPEGAETEYIDLLLRGNLTYFDRAGLVSWSQEAFYPIYDDAGDVVWYVVADVTLHYMDMYMRNFLLKVTVIMAGFFVLIVAYALWTTDVYSTYPVSSMAELMDEFSNRKTQTQEQLDDDVKRIRALDIHTGDEVEKLYRSICSLTLKQAEQMRSIRRLSESTAKMQDGLIITMADMVENRDSDMGAHVQRTTAYVRIIAEGLKKKGYYAEKMSDKFISDVVRSAPLYDVGKIKVPDEILNKPGALTDEEREIVKRHTSYGKEIMENAISSVQGENYMKEARNMAAYHHEYWDGNGYPEGLHGEVIPLSARIMAIADVFDALTSSTVYKKPYTFDEAVEIIRKGSGTQFDPKCTEVFLESLPEVKVILTKYSSMSV